MFELSIDVVREGKSGLFVFGCVVGCLKADVSHRSSGEGTDATGTGTVVNDMKRYLCSTRCVNVFFNTAVMYNGMYGEKVTVLKVSSQSFVTVVC